MNRLGRYHTTALYPQHTSFLIICQTGILVGTDDPWRLYRDRDSAKPVDKLAKIGLKGRLSRDRARALLSLGSAC